MYQLVANRWNFNICFHVWGCFHLIFAVRAPKKRCDYFWLVLWPEIRHFPTRGLLVCENEKLNCFDIQCVIEASSFRLNLHMAQESKENYPQHTKTVQNSLGFTPEVKALHKPRGDLVLCALEKNFLTMSMKVVSRLLLHYVASSFFGKGRILPLVLFFLYFFMFPKCPADSQQRGHLISLPAS